MFYKYKKWKDISVVAAHIWKEKYTMDHTPILLKQESNSRN